MYAPVALFAYKRLDTLIKTIKALQKNPLARDTDLFVFSDGAKGINEQNMVREVRNYLKSVVGFRNIIIYENYENKGLAKSIIEGVSELLKSQSDVIVLEDDIVTTPDFLSFMNAALKKYENELKVFSISGYALPLQKKITPSTEDAYLLRRGWSWGWTTWRSRWQQVDWQLKDYELFRNNWKEKYEFSKGGSDLNSMLRRFKHGKIDSWAIRWFYHQFKSNSLTLYPYFSKAYNIGFNNQSTNTIGSHKRFVPIIK